eukprot:Lithocolla_globosa_v1_NODE_5045_length_1314_cov_15.135028.p2 type:complete len:134 gc:universal NODE_5045_length_1314_cov_15.135028:438-839(+)
MFFFHNIDTLNPRILDNLRHLFNCCIWVEITEVNRSWIIRVKRRRHDHVCKRVGRNRRITKGRRSRGELWVSFSRSTSIFTIIDSELTIFWVSFQSSNTFHCRLNRNKMNKSNFFLGYNSKGFNRPKFRKVFF